MDNSWILVKTNRMIFIMNVVLCAALTIGYIGEIPKGTKTVGFVLVFLTFVAIQIAVPSYVYLKNKASVNFRYFALVSYLALYCFAMFVSPTLITFLFIYPMIVLFVLYYDVKLMRYIGAGLVITNAAKVVYQYANGFNSAADSTDYTVMMAAAVLVAFGLNYVTIMSVKLDGEKIARILEAQEAMKKNAAELHDNINAQMQKTKDIADAGTEIEALSDDMTGISRETHSHVKSAMDNIANLDRETEIVNENSRSVYENIESLNSLAHEIANNAKVVSKIAANTNILALNASVEAARAGEQNKGFMAVAEEIRSLAAQSDDAADNITGIIEALEKKSTESLSDIKNFIANTQAQNHEINSIKEIFSDIDGKTDILLGKIDTLNTDIKTLSAANLEIMSSAENLDVIASRTTDV